MLCKVNPIFLHAEENLSHTQSDFATIIQEEWSYKLCLLGQKISNGMGAFLACDISKIKLTRLNVNKNDCFILFVVKHFHFLSYFYLTLFIILTYNKVMNTK